jgi:hypothetical protein
VAALRRAPADRLHGRNRLRTTNDKRAWGAHQVRAFRRTKRAPARTTAVFLRHSSTGARGDRTNQGTRHGVEANVLSVGYCAAHRRPAGWSGLRAPPVGKRWAGGQDVPGGKHVTRRSPAHGSGGQTHCTKRSAAATRPQWPAASPVPCVPRLHGQRAARGRRADRFDRSPKTVHRRLQSDLNPGTLERSTRGKTHERRGPGCRYTEWGVVRSHTPAAEPSQRPAEPCRSCRGARPRDGVRTVLPPRVVRSQETGLTKGQRTALDGLRIHGATA